MSALWEDIIRFTALSITILCTIYNLYCSYKENSCSAHIKMLISWYVKQYHKGKISQETFLKGMEHLKEISKLIKNDSKEQKNPPFDGGKKYDDNKRW